MIVPDASVVIPAVSDSGDVGVRCRARLTREALVAPEVLDLEVLSGLRKMVLRRSLSARRAGQAVRSLEELPVARMPHRPLIDRMWSLRGNVTPYDASYLALAEALDLTVVTLDGRLARLPGHRRRVELLTDR